jgi:hypothetical protein
MSANREAMLRLRAAWKARGLCTRCGGEKPCVVCRAKWQQYSRNRALKQQPQQPHTST